jgi:hypothetical protein
LKSNIEQSRRIYDDSERIVRSLEEAADRGSKEDLPVEAEELPERLEAHRLEAGEL